MPRLRKPDPLAKAIGRRVRDLLRERGMTLEKLAYENGMSKGTLSDLQRGLARPSIATLSRIANGLDVDLLDLFTRPSERERDRVVDLTRDAPAAALRSAGAILGRGSSVRRGHS